MICLLAKFFVKDYEEYKSPSVRQSYGILSGVTGLAFNIILFISKLFAGIVSGSISIIGDALNNLSDAASSVITLAGFKLSGQEADEEHPFGHGRLEYIAGLIVAFLIITTGIQLIEHSVNRIISPSDIEFSVAAVFILIFSIIIKLIMFQGNLRAAALISSAALKSTAIDSISDVVTTSIVLIATLANHIWGLNIDGYIGCVVGIMIIKAGIDAAKDTINPLLGESPETELIDDVLMTVVSHDGILGAHDLVIHNYGPSRIFMSLHAEVPADRDLVSVHDLIDDIENELNRKYHCTAVIHMDPVMINDEETDGLRRKVSHVLAELDPGLKFHDFRIIHSEGKEERRLTFDVQVPYNYDLTDEEIVEYLVKHIEGIEAGIKCEIAVDKEQK